MKEEGDTRFDLTGWEDGMHGGGGEGGVEAESKRQIRMSNPGWKLSF